MPPVVRYPSSPITPQGAYDFLRGINPVVRLRSFDDSVVFELMGGGSIPDRFNAPECVVLTEPPRGLVAPWKDITQQGASEDGVTFLDSVNEPTTVELKVRAHGRDARHLRQVMRHLYGSLDKKRPSELSWFTQELGRWWAPVRWAKPQPEGYGVGGQRRSANATLILQADNGFWRSTDDVDEFRFAFDSLTDTFGTDYADVKNLGPDWPLYYVGPGGGYIYAGQGMARWRDDPDRLLFTEDRTVVAGPRRGFETETNFQVVNQVFGSFLELGAGNDAILRMGRRSDGSWNGYGTRIRIEGGLLVASAVINFHEQVFWSTPIFPAPLPTEKWTVEAGGVNAQGQPDERMFTVRRGLFDLNVSFRDKDSITPLGPTFRGVGFGMHAKGAWITQGTPGDIQKISAGDQTGSAQWGFVRRLNIGDQPMWDRYTLFGPGTFKIGNGPNTTDFVEFGPLLPNQVVQLRTDGRERAVVDLTSVPPTAGELVDYKKALADLDSFAPIANIAPTREANASAFGVVPPQGNMHRLLKGRFSRPIPPKSPGRPAEEYHVAVSIEDGNASSRILAAGTPRRRYPQ